MKYKISNNNNKNEHKSCKLTFYFGLLFQICQKLCKGAFSMGVCVCVWKLFQNDNKIREPLLCNNSNA